MTMQRRLRVLSWQLTVMLSLILVFSAVDLFSYEMFLVLSILGFALVVDLTRPIAVRPTWWARLRLLLLIGLVGFSILIGRQLIEMV